jgi:beta-mannosidase
VFERLFNVSASMLAQDNVDLVMHGVDTVADIYVNNQLLLSVSNAHRRAARPLRNTLCTCMLQERCRQQTI